MNKAPHDERLEVFEQHAKHKITPRQRRAFRAWSEAVDPYIGIDYFPFDWNTKNTRFRISAFKFFGSAYLTFIRDYDKKCIVIAPDLCEWWDIHNCRDWVYSVPFAEEEIPVAKAEVNYSITPPTTGIEKEYWDKFRLVLERKGIKFPVPENAVVCSNHHHPRTKHII